VRPPVGANLDLVLSRKDAEDQGAKHDLVAAGEIPHCGADWIVVDEIVWWRVYDGTTNSWDTAGALAAPRFNQLREAAKSANPAVKVALVEPFAGLIESFWNAGGRADMLMGEDYRGPHPGDIRAAHLASWKQRFGVAVGEWVLGVTKLTEYSGTDMVIMADWSDAAYPETRYDDTLKRVMLEGCAVASPIDKPFGSLDVVRSDGFAGGWARHRPDLRHARPARLWILGAGAVPRPWALPVRLRHRRRLRAALSAPRRLTQADSLTLTLGGAKQYDLERYTQFLELVAEVERCRPSGTRFSWPLPFFWR
jgi:hypothetical protein